MKKIFLSVLLYYSTFVNASELYNGNGYLAECNKESLYCLGYFEGMVHGTSQAIEVSAMRIGKTYEQFDAQRQWLSMSCIPEKSTIGQLQDVFLKYLKDNPKMRDQPTGRLYIIAMRDAFPCTSNK